MVAVHQRTRIGRTTSVTRLVIDVDARILTGTSMASCRILKTIVPPARATCRTTKILWCLFYKADENAGTVPLNRELVVEDDDMSINSCCADHNHMVFTVRNVLPQAETTQMGSSCSDYQTDFVITLVALQPPDRLRYNPGYVTTIRSTML